MFKPIITKERLAQVSTPGIYTYMIQFEDVVSSIQMSELCASQLQQYIDSAHPSVEIPRQPSQSSGKDWDIDRALERTDPVYAAGNNMDTYRGDYQPPVPGDEVPDDRASGDHKEMDDGVNY